MRKSRSRFLERVSSWGRLYLLDAPRFLAAATSAAALAVANAFGTRESLGLFISCGTGMMDIESMGGWGLRRKTYKEQIQIRKREDNEMKKSKCNVS